MKQQLDIFFTALMFYTRIPCSTHIDHSEEALNKSTRYFPLIGWIVGLISFAVYVLANYLFNTDLAIILSLMAGVLTTGAFHEDGLADVFDGFGGGWTKSKILDIMKDSRVGAYGAIAVIFLLALKFYALKLVLAQTNEQNLSTIALIFISYHTLARFTAINISFTLPYSRDDATSKVKPITKAYTYKEVIGVYLFGLIPLALLCYSQYQLCLVLIPLYVVYKYACYYFKKWLDGYTGDCLGAIEQIAEVVCLLGFIVIWKFIL
jgi:adenosylcobinamide-GDP ribazoletransferase